MSVLKTTEETVFLMLGLADLKLNKSFLTCLTHSLLSALGTAYDEVLTQTGLT